jgi:hypothetical protein
VRVTVGGAARKAGYIRNLAAEIHAFLASRIEEPDYLQLGYHHVR